MSCIILVNAIVCYDDFSALSITESSGGIKLPLFSASCMLF